MIYEDAAEFATWAVSEVERGAENPFSWRFMGVDCGLKKNGLASSNVQNTVASAADVVLADNPWVLSELVLAACRARGARNIVVGYSFAYPNSPASRVAILLARALVKAGLVANDGQEDGQKAEVNVLLYDETGTSMDVKAAIREVHGRVNKAVKKTYDSKVAALILQRALDELGHICRLRCIQIGQT